MTKKIIILIVLLIVASTVNSQSLVKVRADEFFELLAYSKAVNLYEKMHQKDRKDEYAIQQLAICYDKIGDVDKAIEFYKKHLNGSLADADDYYQYAKLLQISEQNELAIEWAQKYLELKPEDERAVKLIKKIEEQAALQTLHIVDEVINEPFNIRFSDMAPAYYKDKIVFASARDTSDMFASNYMWTDQPFLDFYSVSIDGEDQIVEPFSKKINSKYHEGALTFGNDFNTIWYTRNDNVRGKSNLVNLKVFYSHKKDDKWGRIYSFPFNSDEYSVGHPALSPDGRFLYFVSDGLGAIGQTDIFKVELYEDSMSVPVNLGPSINTKGKEMFPFVDNEGILFFASDAHGGFGGLDIFAALPEADSFKVVNIGTPVNSTYDDFGLILSKDKLSGYFTSNRPGGKGDDDIYSFNVVQKQLVIEVRSKASNELIPGAELRVSEGDKNLNAFNTNKEGVAKIAFDDSKPYHILASEKGYKDAILEIAEYEKVLDKESRVVLYLESDFIVKGRIVNSETNEPVNEVLVKTTFNEKPFKDFITDENGLFSFYQDKPGNLDFLISKDGYLAHHLEFNIQDLNSTGFEFTEKIDPVYENKTFVLEGLYYDLNKWDIRPDAAVVLDDVYEIMVDNPTLKIELSSHTDSRGSDRYNQQLSQKRAESAVAYIVSKGIDSNRIVARGYGESRLVNQCGNGVKCSEEEHQLNRRTEIEVTEY